MASASPSQEDVFPAAVVEVRRSVDQESNYSNTRSDPELAARDPELAARDPELAARDPELAARDPELAARDPIIKSILLKLSLK